MADDEPTRWYWCLRHERAEPQGEECGAQLRMGPYPSKEAARSYAETAQAREDTWAAEDERWESR